jgi:hypothetical protein
MFFTSIALATAALVAVVRGDGINIENMPKGVFWCGGSHLLKFSYSANDVPDGTQLRVTLSANTVGSNKVIADLGTVIAPVKEFNVVAAAALSGRVDRQGQAQGQHGRRRRRPLRDHSRRQDLGQLVLRQLLSRSRVLAQVLPRLRHRQVRLRLVLLCHQRRLQRRLRVRLQRQVRPRPPRRRRGLSDGHVREQLRLPVPRRQSLLPGRREDLRRHPHLPDQHAHCSRASSTAPAPIPA